MFWSAFVQLSVNHWAEPDDMTHPHDVPSTVQTTACSSWSVLLGLQTCWEKTQLERAILSVTLSGSQISALILQELPMWCKSLSKNGMQRPLVGQLCYWFITNLVLILSPSIIGMLCLCIFMQGLVLHTYICMSICFPVNPVRLNILFDVKLRSLDVCLMKLQTGCHSDSQRWTQWTVLVHERWDVLLHAVNLRHLCYLIRISVFPEVHTWSIGFSATGFMKNCHFDHPAWQVRR